MIKTIHNHWLEVFNQELKGTKILKIISPFIKENMVSHLLRNFTGNQVQLITRYNLNDFRLGVSSIRALRRLLEAGVEIKGVKGLHSKMYQFDMNSVLITSANFTSGGFFVNKEFGVLTDHEHVVNEAQLYFDGLWKLDANLLTIETLNDWLETVKKSKTDMHKSVRVLADYGASSLEQTIKGRRYFVKFFGKNEHREDLKYETRREIENGCPHYALSFSDKRGRPRRYRDGDVVFMAKMIHGNDYAIFGRGITYAHNDLRDVADEKDAEHVEWISSWPILVRVHSTEFIDSSMENCPKLNDLMNILGYESFQSTLDNYNRKKGNIIPTMALRQQADIKLSETGAVWLENIFQESISTWGCVPDSYIKQFYQGIKI
ncbi:phospholipase D family protein [Reichenbachiella ulvae]|uniref:Phospholipase D family protein n=1 Tax=Reichenbachiella ulvae TaxID=2980104 RepID=A0ABT3D072_9BACT|nr:phospholipase D family protein [Reichenbachiella ulvae]MCV9389145.1 phospholipase D family protein [Reichenbachiella ulvae]